MPRGCPTGCPAGSPAELVAASTREVEKILVFGCSTGEEVVSVADVFPRAVVVGVDVDKALL